MRYARRARHLGIDVADVSGSGWLDPSGGGEGSAAASAAGGDAAAGTVSIQDLLKSGVSYAGQPPPWVAGYVTGQMPFAGEVSYLPSASGGPSFAVFNPENPDAPGTYGAPFSAGAGIATAPGLTPFTPGGALPVAVSTRATPQIGTGLLAQPVMAAYPSFTWGWLLALAAVGWLVLREK